MIFNILGWIGTILMLLDYMLLSMKKIDDGKIYQVINLVSAVLMAIGLFPKDAWFSFTLEVIWGVVALVALIRIMKK